ncbi:coiled-coil domain-containing protein [Nocardiopsis synnemataformans]|uniref:coiled-coil domain-containing protein n=1 Tax=Nocardiopsis synnemataformans TaxID=61305 RepID=UPI003EBE4B3D
MQPDDLSRVDDFADFWAPDPPELSWPDRARALAGLLPAAARPGRARVAALAVAVLGSFLFAPQSTVSAAPVPGEPEDMGSLQDRAEALSEEFNGELRDMEGVIQEAERAEERAQSTREDVDAAREQVRALAVATYTSSGIDLSMSLFVEAEPDEVIDRAVVINYLSTSNQDKIDQLSQALERDETAQENAEEQLAAAEEDLDELEGRREEVQEMIADHPVQPMGGPLNITPRTEQMRELIIEEFGEGTEYGGVGCYRAVGGWVVGEHPKGRACDFMVDPNGNTPIPEQVDRGYAIAEWARENADRLGIMYIIYRQQIWDIRRGDEGWRDMADRGSITENHFDHVHISMF